MLNGLRLSRSPVLYGAHMRSLARLALSTLLLAATAFSQTQNDALQARFDNVIEQGLKDDAMPGIAVGIMQHGKLVYSRAFGAQKLGNPAVPMTPQTLFHMASITKTFVATS